MVWHRRWQWVCGGMLLLAGNAGGCTLVTDVSDFERADAALDADAAPECGFESDEHRDMNLQLLRFDPHVGDDIEVRVVTTDEPPVQVALARLLPSSTEEVLIEMPGAIPPGSHRLDFYADVDGSGDYTPPGEDGMFVDHSWEREPCLPETEFTHDFVFQRLEDPNLIGVPATVEFVDMPMADVRFEMRVIEETSGATVGLVRLPEIEEPDFHLQIPGIMDTGFDYRIAFYIDRNNNGTYDPPPVDDAWEITGVAGGEEVTFEHDPDAVTDIGF